MFIFRKNKGNQNYNDIIPFPEVESDVDDEEDLDTESQPEKCYLNVEKMQNNINLNEYIKAFPTTLKLEVVTVDNAKKNCTVLNVKHLNSKELILSILYKFIQTYRSNSHLIVLNLPPEVSQLLADNPHLPHVAFILRFSVINLTSH